MTIVIFKSDGGMLCGLAARGHSGFSAKGSDIVCAAVSALTQGAVAGMKALNLPIISGVNAKKAFLRLRVRRSATQQEARDAHILLTAAAAAISEIAADHPQHVKVIIPNSRKRLGRRTYS